MSNHVQALKALVHDLEHDAELQRSMVTSMTLYKDGGLTARLESAHTDGTPCLCDFDRHVARGKLLVCGGFEGRLGFESDGRRVSVNWWNG
jgi:hypothetical protein